MEEKNTQVKKEFDDKKGDMKKKVEDVVLTTQSLVKKYK